MSLKKKSITGAFFNLSANGFAQLINFVVYAIMARILGVEEFGLVAICLMVVEFCNLFVTVGISQNLIQRQTWDDKFASLSFWVLMGVSLAIAVFIFTVAVPIAWFSYSELAAQLIAALAVIPIANGFRLVHKARLERDFHNKALAAYDMAGVLAGGAVSIITALQGFGAWAIIYGKIVQAVVSTLLTWVRSSFRPVWVRDREGLSEIIVFAKPLIATAFINFFSSKATNMVIAFFLGAATFAYASVARQGFSVINNLTFQPLNRIALAGLSRVDKQRLSLAFSRITSLTALFVIPVYFGVGAVAPPFITLVFGEKWAQSADLLTLLSLIAPTQVMAYYLPNLLISQGKPEKAFTLNVINLIVNFAFPLALVYWGLTATILGLVIANYVTLILKFKVVEHHIGISLRQAVRNTWMFSVAGLTMFAVVLYCERADVFGLQNLFAELVALVASGALIYSVLLLTFFRTKTFAVLNDLRYKPAK
ncbi:lipopolysaccharide biosynthesis protein [Alteromonas sp. ASW11-19]|uniref:Lipopolysaccharide biosynthesis protein n=1 Tax=Alteromonas salexigens TaxID=2982530 RepID=A0ABT2VS26_9ALTE|nr:lipopolysaccharide biosynthesis protein [Alteromonas salexigens]MCU7556107.1 lipopolysaccharide biosynthesis protein [Alteromonas salexigens]